MNYITISWLSGTYFGILLSGRPVHPALIHADGWVKLACVMTNRRLGVWDGDTVKVEAMERACRLGMPGEEEVP